MSSPPVKEGGPFHTMAAQKIYKSLVVMSTDLPLPPPVSKTVEMSPADDVKLIGGH
jgi:hypothetical protein